MNIYIKLLLSVLVVLFSASAFAFWESEGEKLNPGNNTVLADTGIQPAGTHRFSIVVSSSVANVVKVQLRDASNSFNVLPQLRIRTMANTTVIVDLGSVELGTDERVRVLQDGVAVGEVQVQIIRQ